jgi:hydrogenase maturation protease HycI
MHLNDGLNDLMEFTSNPDLNTILFVGIGNVLRKDDGVGVYISRNLKENRNIRTLTVEVSIENYIGKINQLNPDGLVLIDCTDMQQIPGYYRVLQLDEISDHTFNTHNISLNRLREFFPMPVLILGIQPQHVDFGESLTAPVKEAADRIISSINREFRNNSS